MHNNNLQARFNEVKNKTSKMEQTSTQELLVLHAYGETTEGHKAFLAKELAKDPALQEDLMEVIRAKRHLNSKMKSPSPTSVRIIMEHSYKTEHLQEI
jgi:hypothetical protein